MIQKNIILFFSSIILSGIILFFLNFPEQCFLTEEKIVRGDSMSGILEDGESVKVFLSYYDCNEIKRGDIVLYDFNGNMNPLIKSIKGLPGDSFSFQKSGNEWKILLNGEALKNSENQDYALNQSSYELLSLYERDYNGVIPGDAYFIFGNSASGSLDSSHFGLISNKDILGKIDLQVYEKNN